MDYQEELRKVNERLEELQRENDELKRQLRLVKFLRLQVGLLQVTKGQNQGNLFEGIHLGLDQSADDLIKQQGKIVDDFRKMMLMVGA